MSKKLSVYRLRKGLHDHVRVEGGELTVGYFTVVFGYEYKGLSNIPILCVCYASNGGRTYRVEKKTCLAWYEKVLDTDIDVDDEAVVRKLSEDKRGEANSDTIRFNPQDEYDPVYNDKASGDMSFVSKTIREAVWNMSKDDAEGAVGFMKGFLCDSSIFGSDFNAVLNRMAEIHAAKNHDYGNSFTDLFKECGMTYAYGHLKEKLERIHTLMGSRQEVKKESMLDSLYDLASYAVMTIVELKKKDGMAQDDD